MLNQSINSKVKTCARVYATSEGFLSKATFERKLSDVSQALGWFSFTVLLEPENFVFNRCNLQVIKYL